MKKIVFKVLPLLAGTLLASCTVVQKAEETTPRTVTVNGTGTVLLDADIATVSFSVITFNKDVLTASQQNAETVSKVADALIDAGFSRDSISTSDYRITQDMINRNGVQIRGDYRVVNSLNIVVRNINKVGEAIDVAVKAGANQFNSISFSVTDIQGAIKEARTEAVKKAYEAAKLMVGTSGANLGQVLEIQELSSGPDYDNVVRPMMLSKAAATTPIAVGKTEISISVRCTYAIE